LTTFSKENSVSIRTKINIPLIVDEPKVLLRKSSSEVKLKDIINFNEALKIGNENDENNQDKSNKNNKNFNKMFNVNEYDLKKEIDFVSVGRRRRPNLFVNDVNKGRN
jgi:hypothetical protein